MPCSFVCIASRERLTWNMSTLWLRVARTAPILWYWCRRSTGVTLQAAYK